MAITKSLSQKSSVKQFTNNDLPFSPQQPVINTYTAVSTANQTSISNLGFSIDTVNNPSVFFLYVDGKLLTQGSANDYTFSAIGSNGYSSSITLNQTLPVGLNIQAVKLGLKPEIQFAMDNRFTQLYEAQGQGFQGFVNTGSFLNTATSFSGTPAAGTFYSSIVGRAPMVDLSQDLKPRFGIERIMTQQIEQLQNEMGPNGEPVFSTPNDVFGQIRFVGSAWVVSLDYNGQRPENNNVGDHVEITFYGTGLNVLGNFYPGHAATYSVDGGTAQTVFSSSNSFSSILKARGYASNQLLNVVAGLTLGIHTVTVFCSVSEIEIYGFEVINQNSIDICVNPGVAYIQGQKLVNSSQSLLAYNSVATGTTGGRVLVYQNLNGTIAQAFTQNASSPSYLANANHVNEEVSRVYSPREFGAGRSDDFSNLASAANAAFTLDDGTTTLTADSVFQTINGRECLSPNGVNVPITFTFIGTGVDLGICTSAFSGATIAYSIDGTIVGTTVPSTTNTYNYKIASGLPYGTHTLTFTVTATTGGSFGVNNFTIYQPKKPTLPTGAIELADYNVMANYVANTVAGLTTIASGVLRKDCVRELIYNGTWNISSVSPTLYIGGIEANTSANGAFTQYTFFGTGVEIRGYCAPNLSPYISVTIDGAAPGGTTTTYGGWSYSGNALSQANSTTNTGAGLSISGLTLDLHTIKLVNNTTSPMVIESIDIITPIYSTKSNLYTDYQNTLTVGSNSLSDNRKTSAIKEALSENKVWAQATDTSSNPTITSSSLVPLPNASVTIKTNGGSLSVKAMLNCTSSVAGYNVVMCIYVDGMQVSPSLNYHPGVANYQAVLFEDIILPVSAGAHKVDIYWSVYGGATATATAYHLTVEEI